MPPVAKPGVTKAPFLAPVKPAVARPAPPARQRRSISPSRHRSRKEQQQQQPGVQPCPPRRSAAPTGNQLHSPSLPLRIDKQQRHRPKASAAQPAEAAAAAPAATPSQMPGRGLDLDRIAGAHKPVGLVFGSAHILATACQLTGLSGRFCNQAHGALLRKQAVPGLLQLLPV